MRIEQRKVERAVQVVIGKPLAWALYGSGVILAFVVVAIFRGGKWLVRKRKEVTWEK